MSSSNVSLEERIRSEKMLTSSTQREIFPFPEISNFYNLLQDRLHMVMEQFFLKDPFTIFITALPRDESLMAKLLPYKTQKGKLIVDRFEQVPLISAGLKTQRILLEDGKRNDSLDSHWMLLEKTGITSESPNTVSSQLYAEMKKGKLKLEDLYDKSMGTMESYFADLSLSDRETSKSFPSTRRQAEFHIIDQHLDISSYWYLSVPLIQFAEFDGVVHIVHSSKDHDQFIKKNKRGEESLNKRNVGNVLKAFSREYEGLIINWDLVGENKEKKTALDEALDSANLYLGEAGKVNPILNDLDYKRHYKRHKATYFEERFKYNNTIPGLLYQQSLKNAIITILIDSFAHNVSAHSLTALNWWFKKRAKKQKRLSLKDVAKVYNILQKDIPRESRRNKQLKDLLDPILNPMPAKGTGLDENDIVNYKGPMAKELQPLFKFLLEKGAFWSGVTRDYGFGGEVNDLFDVLWTDFVNNPLYLGTIAKTEEISRINIRVVFYEPEEEVLPNGIRRKRKYAGGDFARINIKEAHPPDEADEKSVEDSYVIIDGKRLLYRDNRELEERSDFVQPGPEYEEIKRELQQCRIFFPGGVVGRHAFYTMLENEIRNVKHYTGKELEHIQKNGLTLSISIQEKHVEPGKSGERELYKIGIWLKLNTKLTSEVSKEQNPHLIMRKYEDLIEDIMDPTESHAPRLGGNFQDKICAAMLFNNTFASVQRGDDNEHRTHADKDTKRDEKYFPWIIPATSSGDNPHEDFELTRDNAKAFDTIYPHKNMHGRFKKYFHCWKGANVKEYPGGSQLEPEEKKEMWDWDNIARFRFITVTAKDKKKRQQYIEEAKNNDVIRVIEEDIPQAWLNDTHGKGTVLAYNYWFPRWLKASQLAIEVKEMPKGQDVFQPKGFFVFNGSEYRGKTPDEKGLKQLFSYLPAGSGPGFPVSNTLNIAHKGTTTEKGVIRYRSHGVYKQYFSEVMAPPAGPDDEMTARAARIAELMEALSTRIAIFDSRVRHRIKEVERDEFFRNTLHLLVDSEHAPVYNEQTGAWSGEWEEAKPFVKNCHFLVMHLTYIESILRTKYGKDMPKDESQIGFFIDKELKPLLAEETGKIRGNFVFVVTTGRGRNQWWEQLKETKNEDYQSYRQFTTFRPVESIIAVVENAINKEDDIELKYYLTKLLFGS